MLAFIDDSGDPGFKFAKGSTTHFVIATCVFRNNLAAEFAAQRIRNFRKKMKLHEFEEFKFNKSNHNLRKLFVQEISSLDFFIRAIVIDKRRIYSNFLRSNPKDFYQYAIKQVLQNSGSTITNAHIKIDGDLSKRYRQTFDVYLRNSLNSDEMKIFHKFTSVNSKNDQLIQLADMVAGSLRRRYEKHDSHSEDIWQLLAPVLEDSDSDIWEYK